MKKKLIPIVLGAAALSCSAIAFAACGSKESKITVTYNANGGEFAENTTTLNESVVVNRNAKQPEDPERAGYELVGWSSDEDGQELWDFRAYSVFEDITLYAVWVKTYTVTYNANGGSFDIDGKTAETYSQTVRTDSLITAECEASKLRGLLVGWSTDKDGENVWDFEEDTVSANVTLYAVWKDCYQVSFYAGYVAGEEGKFENNTQSISLYVPEGETVDEVEIPVLKGYDFAGWKNGNTAWSVDEPITADISLSAIWQVSDTAPLPPITVTRKGNTFSWTKVEGADGYTVVVSHYNDTTEEDEIYRESVTDFSWTFSSTVLKDDITLTKGDNYYITVIAHGDGVKTISSTATTVLRYLLLDSVTGFVFNTTTGELRWDAVANASKYELSIDGEEKFTVYTNYYSLAGYTVGTHTVTVAPCNNDYVQPSASYTTVVQKILTTPKNLKTGIERGYRRLSWDEVPGADSYIINIGNEKITTPTNYYDFEDDSLFTNGVARVTVQAFNSDGLYLISNTSGFVTVEYYYYIITQQNDGSTKVMDYTVTKTSTTGSLAIPNMYTVVFDQAGQKTNYKVSATNYLPYKLPNNHSSGYVFRGWYNSSDDTLYDFTQPITSDINLYAQYYLHSGYSNIDFYLYKYTSADRTFAFNATSSGSRYYFSLLTDGTYVMNFTSSTTTTTKTVTIYNVTQDKAYSYSSNKFTSKTALSFTANAGDVLYVEVSAPSSSKVELYLSGLVTPPAGGLGVGYTTASYNKEIQCKYEIWLCATYGTKLTYTAVEEEDGKTFVGWYIGDECVSEEKSYSFTVTQNVGLIAKYETDTSEE